MYVCVCVCVDVGGHDTPERAMITIISYLFVKPSFSLPYDVRYDWRMMYFRRDFFLKRHQ